MQAHLLIDGYNVILGLPHLEKIFQRDKERARDELGRIARNIHDADAIRVIIVFDGSGGVFVLGRHQGQRGRGSGDPHEKRGSR